MRMDVSISEKWKCIRAEMGALIGQINSLVEYADSAEELKKRSYDKGFRAGCEKADYEMCKDCAPRAFEMSCTGRKILIDRISRLPADRLNVVEALVNLLSDEKM